MRFSTYLPAILSFAASSLAFENYEGFTIYDGADQPGECTGAVLFNMEQTCGLAGWTQQTPNAACIQSTQGQNPCCAVYLYSDSGCSNQVGCFFPDSIGATMQIDFECAAIACDDPQGC